MKTKYYGMLAILLSSTNALLAQTENITRDSLYIQEVENHKGPAKVLHAEPLYIDLIRDLGARKGEKEWNIGMGLTDNFQYDSYTALIEYEWAPINRLGFEVELPFTFYSPLSKNAREVVPANRLNSLKLATQWTFLVKEDIATSMAIGYIHEFELADFKEVNSPYWKGNVFNPFMVVAKRWGRNFHSLLYTGPMLEKSFQTNKVIAVYDLNTSFHYMISGTRNFIGVEFNQSQKHGQMDLIIRPQMRLGIAENLLVGIVAGIPTQRENERFSSFARLNWEPSHKKNH